MGFFAKSSVHGLVGRAVVAAALVASSMPALPREVAAEPATTVPGIAVVFTNDVHCAYRHEVDGDTGFPQAIGYDYLAGYIDALEVAHGGEENVTVVDAGDAVQGGPVGTVTEGAAIVELMDAVGYDYAVPGNHEFDYGMDRFMELVESSQATYLSSNFERIPSGECVLKPYDVVTYAGVDDGTESGCDGATAADDGVLKVAYVGISTPETLTKSSPANFQDENGVYIYGFNGDESGQALYDNVQESVDAARAEGADYVVAVAHLGDEGTTPRWTSAAVIENTTGIDAMIDGHSHEAYERTVENEDGEPVTLVQTGTKMENLGVLTIDPAATDPVDTQLVSAAEVTTVNETVSAVIDRISADLDTELGEQVGTAAIDLTVNDEQGVRRVRKGETNMGDLVADAYRAAVPGAQVGLANGGGIRADIAAGPITKEQIIDVQPYGNMLCLVEVSGQTLLDALEMASSNYPEESGAFLQVSGMSYRIDPTVPSSVVTDANGNFVSVDGPRRVYDVRVDGAPIDPMARYKVASHGFMLLEGGDGMTMFKDATVLLQEVALDNQAMIDYIVRDLGGTVSAGYEDIAGAGRIVVAEQPLEPETPTDPVDPTDPVGPETPVDPGASSKPGFEGSVNGELPQTGDLSLLGMLAGGSVGASLGVAGLWLTGRRRHGR